MSQEEECPDCDGTGNALHKGQLTATKVLGFRICPECGGTGKKEKRNECEDFESCTD